MVKGRRVGLVSSTIALLVSLCGCSATAGNTPAKSQPAVVSNEAFAHDPVSIDSTYINSAYSFQVKYPDNWVSQERPTDGYGRAIYENKPISGFTDPVASIYKLPSHSPAIVVAASSSTLNISYKEIRTHLDRGEDVLFKMNVKGNWYGSSADPTLSYDIVNKNDEPDILSYKTGTDGKWYFIDQVVREDNCLTLQKFYVEQGIAESVSVYVPDEKSYLALGKDIIESFHHGMTCVFVAGPIIQLQSIPSENGGFQVIATHGFEYQHALKHPKLVSPEDFTVEILDAVNGSVPLNHKIPINNHWVRYITLTRLGNHSLLLHATLIRPAISFEGGTSGGFLFGYTFGK